MTLPSFLAFDPVPVRARHDGWTPGLQRRFVLLLARGSPPSEAARRLGRSRQTAYALRKRPGGGAFAAAWDAARAFADEVARAGSSRLPGDQDFDMLLVPRFYRGRLVGYVQREDHRTAFRTLARLDRIADAALAHEGFDFDELVRRAAESQAAETDKADEMNL